jgi:hypothetical protein
MLGAAALAAALGMAAEPARYRSRQQHRAPQTRERVVPPAVAEDVVPFPPPTITILRVFKDRSTFDERWRAQWGR